MVVADKEEAPFDSDPRNFLSWGPRLGDGFIPRNFPPLAPLTPDLVVFFPNLRRFPALAFLESFKRSGLEWLGERMWRLAFPGNFLRDTRPESLEDPEEDEPDELDEDEPEEEEEEDRRAGARDNLAGGPPTRLRLTGERAVGRAVAGMIGTPTLAPLVPASGSTGVTNSPNSFLRSWRFFSSMYSSS